jgi:hypothetical protein
VRGLGTSSIESTVLGGVLVCGVACGCESAMDLAPADGPSAASTPARVDDTRTGGVWQVATTPVVAFGACALEDVGGALERGELGSADLELDPQLANSDSWTGAETPRPEAVMPRHGASRARRSPS